MGAMKRLDHDLVELVEMIDPASNMLQTTTAAYEARDVLMQELLERGWVPPTLAEARERKANADHEALESIAIELGAAENWDSIIALDVLNEVAVVLGQLGFPDPAEVGNTDYYKARKEARDSAGN